MAEIWARPVLHVPTTFARELRCVPNLYNIFYDSSIHSVDD
eukprot:COSAG01_NODE_19380_length_1013_cov_1.055799_1_plen_40_part_01